MVLFIFTRPGRDALLFFVLLATFIPIHESIHYAFAYVFGLYPWWEMRPGAWITWWTDGGPVLNAIILHAPSALFIGFALLLFKVRYPLGAFALIIAGVHSIWGHIVGVV